MKRAFTLVELLVVLAIVGVLAMCLFPIFAKARENARRSSCQSNLKQIALGYMQYSRDYDEKFMLDYADRDGLAGFNPAFDQGWAQILQPYLKSTSIFMCPTEATPPTFPPMSSDYWYAAPLAKRDLSAAGVFNPSLTVMFGDSDQRSAANMATHGAIAYAGDAPSLKYNGEIWDITEASEGMGGRRHLDGINFAFADGHVKWLKPETVAAAPVSSGKATFRVN